MVKIRKKLIPIAILTVAFVFGFGIPGKEVRISSVGELSHALLGQPQQKWRWADKVEEGKSLLRQSHPLSYTFRKVGSKQVIVEKQIALAVLDTLSGEVFEKRIWIEQDEISSSKTKRFEGIDAKMDQAFSPQYPAKIRIEWWNSFNSVFKVDPSHYVVLANKHLLPSDLIPDPSERSGAEYTEIIYVPYSDNVHNSQLVGEGKRYLEQIIDRVFRELEIDQVKSRVDPGSLVTKSASRDLIEKIIVTEHIDPDLLAFSDDSGKILAERVYIIVGTNKDNAYYYTSSSADARGIGQFIKATYLDIVERYPEAGLIKDFKIGTSLHSNAIKAMVLLFDNNKAYLGALLDIIREDEVDLALAASYNGNPKWVRESILLYGNKWLEHQPYRKILKPETFGYIEKLKALINLNFWN